MGLPQDMLKPSKSPFHGVIPGTSSVPIGQISLQVTFGTRDNYRTEMLTFEVADFDTSYHAILGRPGLAKFMAIPHYTYLVFKMLGLASVIRIQGDVKHAYVCDKESYEIAENVAN